MVPILHRFQKPVIERNKVEVFFLLFSNWMREIATNGNNKLCCYFVYFWVFMNKNLLNYTPNSNCSSFCLFLRINSNIDGFVLTTFSSNRNPHVVKVNQVTSSTRMRIDFRTLATTDFMVTWLHTPWQQSGSPLSHHVTGV